MPTGTLWGAGEWNALSVSVTKAAAAKYTTQMVPYKGALTTEQINNIAAYVYVSTHKPS